MVVRLSLNQQTLVIDCLVSSHPQIIAFVSGDHSAKTCAKLWAKIPASYKRCHTVSDFRDAYAKVVPKATHRSVGKDAGKTCHMERWNCTLGQRLARFVRKTLSFSKSDVIARSRPQRLHC